MFVVVVVVLSAISLVFGLIFKILGFFSICQLSSSFRLSSCYSEQTLPADRVSLKIKNRELARVARASCSRTITVRAAILEKWTDEERRWLLSELSYGVRTEESHSQHLLVVSPCNKCNTWVFWKSFAGNMWKCVWITRARSAFTSRSSCLVWWNNDSGDKHGEDERWKPSGGAVDDTSIGNKCRHWGTYKMVSSTHILCWGRGMSVDFITEDCLLAHYALRGNHSSQNYTSAPRVVTQ